MVVPTVGGSPYLGRCLEALRRDGGEALELVVVHQGPSEPELPPGLADQLLRLPEPLGFAAATNRGLAAGRGRWLATVNDDAVVEPGWTAALRAALEGAPRAAAAQGVNLLLADPARCDGCGLAFNRRWQAVQLGRGGPPPQGAAREVFGVSATAALFRRRALQSVALDDGATFDPALGSYYEDVDLACRLRAAGWSALSVPRARALHAGSLTGARLGWRRWALLTGNRWLVLARLLGSRLRRQLPRVARADLGELAGALRRGDGAALAGIPAGWLRAARRLRHFAHRGAPAVAEAELDRLAAEHWTQPPPDKAAPVHDAEEAEAKR